MTLRAVPALRLLAERGDEIKVRGSGLEYEFDDPDRPKGVVSLEGDEDTSGPLPARRSPPKPK